MWGEGGLDPSTNYGDMNQENVELLEKRTG